MYVAVGPALPMIRTLSPLVAQFLRPLFVLPLLAAACSSGPARPEPDGAIPPDSAAPVDAGDTGTASRDAGDAGDTGDTGTAPDADAGPAGDLWAALSLNLHCLDTGGSAFGTNDARFAAIARGATAEGVRVLLLQEVCTAGTVDALAALEGALEATTGQDWYGSFAFAHVAWEGTPQEADEGVAILADVPLVESRVLEHGAAGSLRRVMLSAGLGGDLAGLRVGTFHLDHADDAARRLQARELATAGLVHGASANVLLGGDLNDREGSAPYQALAAAGYLDAAPALRPSRIDHVFVHRGAGFAAASAALLFDRADERVSDHPGVLVRLRATAGASIGFTMVEVEVDVGAGDRVFVRGDQAPLSWDEGWPAIATPSRLWTFATTEMSRDFEYKALRNDIAWSAGENYRGSPGVTNRATVTSFE